MRLPEDVIIAAPIDGHPGRGPEAHQELLTDLTNKLFSVPKKIGEFFFVDKKFFEKYKAKHPGASDGRFREWSAAFEALSLYPVTKERFEKRFIPGDEPDDKVPGDVVLFGIQPRTRADSEDAPKEHQSYKFVVYISTAEGKAVAFPELNEHGEPAHMAVDMWDFYVGSDPSSTSTSDDPSEDTEDNDGKEYAGVQAILDYFGSPDITFIALNPTIESLRTLHGGVHLRQIVKSI